MHATADRAASSPALHILDGRRGHAVNLRELRRPDRGLLDVAHVSRRQSPAQSLERREAETLAKRVDERCVDAAAHWNPVRTGTDHHAPTVARASRSMACWVVRWNDETRTGELGVVAMRGKQWPPRGPRSCHVKIDVTIEERKQAEAVAQLLGCTVVEAYKAAMRRTHLQMGGYVDPNCGACDSGHCEPKCLCSCHRGDHVPAVVREADGDEPEPFI